MLVAAVAVADCLEAEKEPVASPVLGLERLVRPAPVAEVLSEFPAFLFVPAATASRSAWLRFRSAL